MFVQGGNRRFQVIWTATLTAAWIGVSYVFGMRPHGSALVPTYLWAAVNAGLSFWILDYLGSFSSLHPLPSRSQIFTFILIFPLIGSVCKYLALFSTDIEVIHYRYIFYATPVVSLIAFSIEYLLGRSYIASGEKRLAFCVLEPHEFANLELALQEKGLRDFYELIDGTGEHGLERALENPSDVNWIVISRERSHKFSRNNDLLLAYNLGIPIFDHRQLCSGILGRVDLTDYNSWAFLVQAAPTDPAIRIYREIKPLAERLVAILMLLAVLPLLALVALTILVLEGRPVLYKQKRMGFRGRTFRIIKFRTMRNDAEAGGPAWSQANDPRVNALGKFLRNSRLDELPQLWNVAVGQMSFVGPRPERPEFHSKLREQIPFFDLRLMIRPGITGWSQVTGGYASSVEESRLKLEYDLFYVQHMSPRLDLVIIIRTVMTVLLGRQFMPSKATLSQRSMRRHSQMSR